MCVDFTLNLLAFFTIQASRACMIHLIMIQLNPLETVQQPEVDLCQLFSSYTICQLTYQLQYYLFVAHERCPAPKLPYHTGFLQFLTVVQSFGPFFVHVHRVHQSPILGTLVVPMAYHVIAHVGPADEQVCPPS